MTGAPLPVLSTRTAAQAYRHTVMKAPRCFGVCLVLLAGVSAGGAVGAAEYSGFPGNSSNQSSAVLTGFADLRCPDNVSVDSLNTRYVLRWDWPHESAVNQTVTFTVQYLAERLSRKASHEKYWTSMCVDVLEHRCDFTAAELHYLALYLLRVRANTSQRSSGWVQIRFCPDKHAALGPPSSVRLRSVKGHLEIIITDPVTSSNQSMKTLLDNNLRYLIQYWRRSEEPKKAKVLQTENNVVMLTDLDRQTWYCVRVQSRYDFYNKISVFSDTHCTRTEGQMPYWQIFLYFLISLLLSFLLVVLLSFCCYKMFTLLKNTFCPAIQLPDHIQELWLSDSEKPQLLAPESPESVCELLVMVSAELDAVAVDEHSNTEDQDSSTHGRHGSGDSGVYSTEEDSGHRSDLQMSSRKHREELHDGTLLEL
ncbi:interferon alpha/beta receptor 1b-like isoform X2 [Sinocyclocheilus anshuiensis]|uniref:interferon alpha/beta receptor 1b-like isoform X2 n=1 Tax=Sinocyclocheilus anshuiensis TaxID=1608454 RepID=UPI0007BA5B7E|nr:PREDICTED: interferon alpha/beta receptor 1b-like isoform X2 [Sinocyclocheilus anshuiensis]